MEPFDFSTQATKEYMDVFMNGEKVWQIEKYLWEKIIKESQIWCQCISCVQYRENPPEMITQEQFEKAMKWWIKSKNDVKLL